jgi:hypothetical protein
MKLLILLISSVVTFTSLSQDITELPKLDLAFSWNVQLIPFEDGSYAVTTYSWETYTTTMYSASNAKLNSITSKKQDWRYYNGMGTTGTGCLINQSLVDGKTKNAYTVIAGFKKMSFSVTNERFETQTYESAVNLDGFNSYCDKTSFIDEDGNAYFLFWQDVIENGQQRKVVVVFYDQKSKKLTVKMNELSPVDAAYFSFLGFLDDRPVFGSMKKGTVQSKVILNLYGLTNEILTKTGSLDILLDEEIKPEYICGIDYEKIDSKKMTFAIGLAKMDGLVKQVGNGYKFIQMENQESYSDVDWWLKDYDVRGKVPMGSVVLSDTLERVILSGSMFKLAVDVDFPNKKVSNQKVYDVDGYLWNWGFWTYILSKDFQASNIIPAVEKLINPNNSKNAMIAETPQIIQFSDKRYVIARVFGPQSRKLEIINGQK